MDANELAYWYWMTDVKGIGPTISRRLLEQFHHPYQVHTASKSELVERANIKIHLIDNIELSKRRIDKYEELARKQLEIADRLGGWILTCNDEPYKSVYWEHERDESLPTIIHVLGNEKLLSSRKFAIVGTRHPSEFGKSKAKDLAYNLVSRGITVISGLAVGIDAWAHIGALEARGATIAILGCGADIPYPRENENLYREILARGLILSEFPFGVRITTENLRKRNRTIVAFAEGTIVAECPVKSGAMIAARFTSQQNKPLLSFRYNEPVDNSGGMWLIEHHLAAELTSPTLDSLEFALTHFDMKTDVNVDKLYEELWPKKKKILKTTIRPRTKEGEKESAKPTKKYRPSAAHATLEGVQKELPIDGAKQNTKGEKTFVESTFKEGDRVVHPKFGAGNIVKITPIQGDFQVTIRFSPRKTQTFLLKYANLTLMK